jgi:hypothetical protein
VRQADDLPNEIKGKAKWSSHQGLNGESAYYIINKGQVGALEYINDEWYWLRYNKNAGLCYSAPTFRISNPAIFGLGTKALPFLTEEDCIRLQAYPADKGKQPEEDKSQIAAEETATDLDEDLAFQYAHDEDLATTLAGHMATTTITETAQTAYARGGGSSQARIL